MHEQLKGCSRKLLLENALRARTEWTRDGGLELYGLQLVFLRRDPCPNPAAVTIVTSSL